ncbi:flagellar biosynthesis protein FliW [Malaciobacter molluscorum LMG 25693]|uniref:Flagellar biosynthesis protein FliW n=1 Tax=Malaciobacter molluscorum LMG 25693 TaxID=870501 RepID=A0A2G1DH39_9BACT|nr:flagellar assembly protein FliW [Malaciobacter molluscorum]AXX93402.1 putative flagellin level sensor protein FliW [Malaciobacter molluscorum LMG 25693]PHO17805.1 flagellar biosynthesis protein FliW [Malaciobacter molluscorum LMG 25693]
MYEVKIPILGFDNINKMDIKQLDDDFFILELDKKEDTSMYLLSSNSIKSFDININDEYLTKLQINDKTKISIYYSVVVNNPISNSVINLGAPIIVNEDKQTIGQCIINSGYLFSTFKELNTL